MNLPKTIISYTPEERAKLGPLLVQLKVGSLGPGICTALLRTRETLVNARMRLTKENPDQAAQLDTLLSPYEDMLMEICLLDAEMQKHVLEKLAMTLIASDIENGVSGHEALKKYPLPDNK